MPDWPLLPALLPLSLPTRHCSLATTLSKRSPSWVKPWKDRTEGPPTLDSAGTPPYPAHTSERKGSCASKTQTPRPLLLQQVHCGLDDWRRAGVQRGALKGTLRMEGHREKGNGAQKIKEQQPNRSWARAEMTPPYPQRLSRPHSSRKPWLAEAAGMSLRGQLYSPRGAQVERPPGPLSCQASKPGATSRCPECSRPKGSVQRMVLLMVLMLLMLFIFIFF